MPYVRRTSGLVTGTFTYEIPGFATEFLPDGDDDILFQEQKSQKLNQLEINLIFYLSEVSISGNDYSLSANGLSLLNTALIDAINTDSPNVVWILKDGSSVVLPTGEAKADMLVIQNYFTTVYANYNSLKSQIDAAMDFATIDAIDVDSGWPSSSLLPGPDIPILDRSGKSYFINGNMDIWQRGTTFAAATDDQYVADRWVYNTDNTSGVATLSRDQTVPVGSKHSLLTTVTTADATMDAGDLVTISQRISGENVVDFALGTADAATITISFWVRSSKTGTYTAALQNQAQNRSYVTAFTVDAADTYEKKVITINLDQSGTWTDDSLAGLRFSICLMGGTTYQAMGSTWSSGEFYAVGSQVNFFENNAETFYLTQVKLEKNPVATAFVPRRFDEELEDCYYYFQKTFPYATAPQQNAGRADAFEFKQPSNSNPIISTGWVFPRPMRATPTVVTFNPLANNSQIRNVTDANNMSGTAVLFSSGSRSVYLTGNESAGQSRDDLLSVHMTVSAEI